MAKEEKEPLRIKMKNTLKRIRPQRVEKSSALVAQLNVVLKDLEGGVIGCFSPLDTEPDLFFKTDKKWRLAYNRFVANGEMVFLECKQVDLVESFDYGVRVLVPPEDSKIVIPETLLVPGLAFSREGCRLGRGKGYYDKYLKEFQGTKIGICFKEQIVDDLPIEEHDEKVDFIVTDSEIIRCFK